MMTRANTLNPFQRMIRGDIQGLLQQRGLAIQFTVEGENETYVSGFVPEAGLTLWIYEDELELRGPNAYFLLERPDFDDLHEMASYFTDQLVAVLDKQQRGGKG